MWILSCLSGTKLISFAIYQTREIVFHQDIQTLRRELKIRWSIFDEIRGVWISSETLSPDFDIFSQSKQKQRSKRRSKIVKTYGN